MWSYHNNNNILRGWKKTFGGYGYVYDLDCDDSFTTLHLSPDSSSCVNCTAICILIISQYLNKVFLKRI